jgi:hypothetical protein
MFNIGDIVKVVKLLADSGQVLFCTGKVITVYLTGRARGGYYGVEFKDFSGGHTCNGKGKANQCWDVCGEALELIIVETPQQKVLARVKKLDEVFAAR